MSIVDIDPEANDPPFKLDCPCCHSARAMANALLFTPPPSRERVLGLLWQAMGQPAKALLCHQRALHIFEQTLGPPNHLYTAMCLDNIGQLLQHLGDLEQVRPSIERALEIRLKVLGPEHPDTVVSLRHMAQLLEAAGDLEAARPFLEQCLASEQAQPGAAHGPKGESRPTLRVENALQSRSLLGQIAE